MDRNLRVHVIKVGAGAFRGPIRLGPRQRPEAAGADQTAVSVSQARPAVRRLRISTSAEAAPPAAPARTAGRSSATAKKAYPGIPPNTSPVRFATSATGPRTAPKARRTAQPPAPDRAAVRTGAPPAPNPPTTAPTTGTASQPARYVPAETPITPESSGIIVRSRPRPARPAPSRPPGGPLRCAESAGRQARPEASGQADRRNVR